MPNTFETFSQFSLKSARANECCWNHGQPDAVQKGQSAQQGMYTWLAWANEKLHSVWLPNFLLNVFSPSHRLGSISAKLCCAVCSYTESVKRNNQQKTGKRERNGKERGRHLTTVLMSGPAPFCCSLLLFSPMENCSGYNTSKSPPRIPENPQDLNNWWYCCDPQFHIFWLFWNFNYTACTFH